MDIPDDIDELDFEDKVEVLMKAGTTKDMRRRIDGALGLENPRWRDNTSIPQQFSKRELAILILALRAYH